LTSADCSSNKEIGDNFSNDIVIVVILSSSNLDAKCEDCEKNWEYKFKVFVFKHFDKKWFEYLEFNVQK
jgi:hypothetical protein